MYPFNLRIAYNKKCLVLVFVFRFTGSFILVIIKFTVF